ncbi:MAG: ABC transporter substrate-binding protein [Desulfovibrionaceae bacterium]
MKRLFSLFFLFSMCVPFLSCSNSIEDNNNDPLRVGTSADYYPFEFKEDTTFAGFDIDLMKMIAKKLDRKIVFIDAPFASLLPMLEVGQIDITISAINITSAREKAFDMTIPYFFDTIVALYPKKALITDSESTDILETLQDKKVGVQLGTTMQSWAEENLNKKMILTMDTTPALIEALKASQIDVVLIDKTQGDAFLKKNEELASMNVSKTKEGYALVLKKGSPLTKKINAALEEIIQSEEIKIIEKEWLEQ